MRFTGLRIMRILRMFTPPPMTSSFFRTAKAVVFSAILPAVCLAQSGNEFQKAIAACDPVYWYRLDNSPANSGSGGNVPLTQVETSFANGFFDQPATALQFNSPAAKAHSGSTDVVSGGGSGPDAAAGTEGSLVILFKTPTAPDGKTPTQHYLFRDQTGSAANKNQLGLFLTSDGAESAQTWRLGLNFGGMSSSTLSAGLEPDTWYFLAIGWNEARNDSEARVFLGRAGDSKLMVNNAPRDVSDDSVVGANSVFNLGNFSNTNTTSGFISGQNPGLIDEFATFNRELSQRDVLSLFSALVH